MNETSIPNSPKSRPDAVDKPAGDKSAAPGTPPAATDGATTSGANAPRKP